MHGVYTRRLDQNQVEQITGKASFVAPGKIEVAGQTYQGQHICIATGSYPQLPEVPGSDLGITSDGFFQLQAVPREVAVVGAGYIAAELAGLLNA